MRRQWVRATAGRFLLWEDASADEDAAFVRDVRRGLGGAPKSIPPRHLYDREGSHLFEQICDTPEYYLWRAEREILEDNADDIVAALPGPAHMVELGSGNGSKTRLLVSALLKRQRDLLYVPIDVSYAALRSSAARLLPSFPSLRIAAIAGEYAVGLRRLAELDERRKVVLWLGATIGNFDRPDAAAMLAQIAQAAGSECVLLVGFDLRKDRTRLVAAYDDAAGVTAAFNRNLLARINRELDGQFDLEGFAHRVTYDENAGRIEMHLESRTHQRVPVERIGGAAWFAAGETIHTESAYKYSPEEIEDLAAKAGLMVRHAWLDVPRRFTIVLLIPRVGRNE